MNAFANPGWLWTALPALGVFAFYLASTRRKSGALNFPEVRMLKEVPPSAAVRFFQWTPDLLKIAALALAIVALARPQRVWRQAFDTGAGIDILLCVDTSTSMRALDFNPDNRLDAAKRTIREFIKSRIEDRIGVVVFAGSAMLQCPLTTDYGALLDFLDAVEIGMTKTDGTAIGDALGVSLNHLQNSPAESKVLILLTDGRNNQGEIDPLTAAKAAANLGIKIYTIGTGAKGQALYPVDDPLFGRRLVPMPEDLDEKTLRYIAAAAQGKYFRATTSGELKSIYAEINKLEKSKIKLPEITLRKDYYPYFLTPALLLLFLELILTRTALLRLP
ncbi:MAG: VWA domain-containing protein [Elusimicrobia bacterium]|nr:VWA domain-containing protein [Elusimicrobiota bacterium]